MPGDDLTPGPPATKKGGGSHHREGRDNRQFPARWFYGLYVLFSVTFAWLPPSAARRVSIFAALAPASERQNHTTSPSALASLVLRRYRVHRIPLPTSVTTAKRPSCGNRTAGAIHNF